MVIVTGVPGEALESLTVTLTPVVEVWSEEALPPETVVVEEPWAVVPGCSTTREPVPMLPRWSESPP